MRNEHSRTYQVSVHKFYHTAMDYLRRNTGFGIRKSTAAHCDDARAQ
jgi:hypothetical protein